VLDSPEAINAWMAERKRRFPTDEKIQDKKRKLEEAAARGQLTPEDIGAGARKKYRQDTAFTEDGRKGYRGKGHQRGRGRRRQGLAQREELRTEIVNDLMTQPADAKNKCTQEASSEAASIVDDDEAPEVVSSKVPTTPPCIPKVDVGHDREAQMSHAYPQQCARRIPQPKKPPRNPFVSRSTLLRNVLGTCYLLALTTNDFIVKLLLPEIRVTVSNLSQAIRFLVENDFLRDVELRPGEAQEQMIEVLGSNETPSTAGRIPEPFNGM